MPGKGTAARQPVSMRADTVSKRTTGRTLLILAPSLYVFIGGLADISRLWQPIGWFGATADHDGVVTHVAAGSPADAAGIRAGDRFDVAALAPQQRWYLFPENCAPPGASLSVDVMRDGVISVVGAAAPIGVAYAILKHRVVNVSFVVSRTIVYGTITAILIATFAFIDWLVGRVLDQSRLAVVAEVIAAIAIGFSLNGLHRQIDRFVDGLLFRSRHAAERTLTRFAAGLPHAASFELVDEMLAEETTAALGLTSAAVFRRTSEHCFDRMAAVGWEGATATRLTERDRLVLHLEGERQALKLADVRWNRTDLPAAPAEPALALPVFVRHQLEGIVVLGAHATGEDFDAYELRLLTNCAVAAGAAYDHLDADALRRRVEDLQRMLDSLRPSAGAQEGANAWIQPSTPLPSSG